MGEVLKTALIHDGLARGANEATKALDKRQAHLCILSNSVDEPMYTKLIEALCAEHGINLLRLMTAKSLESGLDCARLTKRERPVKSMAWCGRCQGLWKGDASFGRVERLFQVEEV